MLLRLVRFAFAGGFLARAALGAAVSERPGPDPYMMDPDAWGSATLSMPAINRPAAGQSNNSSSSSSNSTSGSMQVPGWEMTVRVKDGVEEAPAGGDDGGGGPKRPATWVSYEG